MRNHSAVLIMLAGIATLLGVAFAWTANAAEAVDGDVQSLAITYRTTPANRAALRVELQSSGLTKFEHWKQEGVIKSYRVLFNRYADSASWDAVALLTFARDADMERWNKLERTYTAGLTQKALELTSAIDTAPVDLVRSRSDTAEPANPVFLVIPYEVLIPASDYLDYADGYTLPQFDGWIREGVLTAYQIYLSRYPAGRPWSSLIVLEYKSEQALGARDATVAKVRAQLKDDPKWKAISDNKKNVRNEKQLVVAEELKEH